MTAAAATRFVLGGMKVRRVRVGLTTFGVALGIALVVGMSVLTTSLYSSLTSLTTAIYGKAQLVVAPRATGATLDPVDMRLARNAPGVARVDGVLYFPAQQVTGPPRSRARRLGDRLTVVGISAAGANDAVGLAGVAITRGRAPRRGAEIALDRQWAARNRLRLGEDLSLAVPAGTKRFRLVGTFVLPALADVLGQSFAAIPLSTARTALQGRAGFDELTIVLKAGASPTAARAYLVRRLGASAKVETPVQRARSLAAQLALLKVVVAVLTAMGLVVAAFLTRNCFALTTHEREREFGILRAIGTSRATILTLVLIEALIIGVAASLGGLGLGLLAGRGMLALASTSGYRLAGLALPQATLLIASCGGILATLAGALPPALQASRRQPLASLDARGADAAPLKRSSTAIGVGAVAGGLVTCYAAAGPAEHISTPTLAIAIFAMGLTFAGAALLAPAAVGPLARLMRWPLKSRGRPEAYIAAGALTWNQRRSATTAAVVMLGVALAVAAGSLTSSVITSVSDQLGGTEKEDFSVQPRQFSELSIQPEQAFSDQLRSAIAKLPGTAVVSPQRMIFSQGVFTGDTTLITAVDPAAFARVQRLRLEGTSVHTAISALARGEAIIGDGLAATHHMRVGQSFVLRGSRQMLPVEVAGIAQNLLNNGDEITVSLAVLQRTYGVTGDSLLDIGATSPHQVRSLRRAVDRLLARDYPQLETLTPHQLSGEVSSRLGAAAALANVLLLLIATISIVAVITTLGLNIVERTREIGVLRSIGLSPEQLRAAVRLESVSLCLMGAICGIAVGVALGVALVLGVARSIPSLGYAPPGNAVVGALVWAVALGLLAAAPALRRASRISITRAIAYE